MLIISSDEKITKIMFINNARHFPENHFPLTKLLSTKLQVEKI